MEPRYCFTCKSFNNMFLGLCKRDASYGASLGSLQGTMYSCNKERGFDDAYLRQALEANHEICGVEGKFYEESK